MSRLAFPVIGLPTLSIPAGVKPERFGINQSYVRALEAAGAVPVLIPLLADEERQRVLYRRLDGIVFPGGKDVNPSRYGEDAIGELNDVEPIRDQVELTLAGWALDDDLPVLGICRGQQLINVALGGSLYQDLRYQGATRVDHSDADGRARDALIHTVRLDPDSKLAQLIDETSVEVNSLHHQAIKEIGKGLQVSGQAPDGVIEAVEDKGRRFLVAVQWHPEELPGVPWVERLFAGYVRAPARD